MQGQKAFPANLPPSNIIPNEFPVQEKPVLVFGKIIEGGVKSILLHPQAYPAAHVALNSIFNCFRQCRTKDSDGKRNHQRHNLSQGRVALKIAAEFVPERRVCPAILNKVGDFPEPAEPAPIVKDVLKYVQGLEEKRIFL